MVLLFLQGISHVYKMPDCFKIEISNVPKQIDAIYVNPILSFPRTWARLKRQLLANP